MTVVIPERSGIFEFTGTVVEPGITTSSVPDISVVLPGNDPAAPVGLPKTTGTVVGFETTTYVEPEMTVVLPKRPGSLEFTGTVVEPGITTFKVPDISVVLPGSDCTT